MANQGPASRNDNPSSVLMSGAAGKRVFVTSIAFTSASGNTALPTTTDATLDGARAIPSNAIWVFQPTGADCHVALTKGVKTITNTNAALITAGLFDEQISESTDTYISYKGDSASGNLLVFVLL